MNGEGKVGQATNAQLRMLKTGQDRQRQSHSVLERSSSSRFQHTERMKGTLNGVGLTAPRRVPQVPVKMAKTIQASLRRSIVSCGGKWEESSTNQVKPPTTAGS